MASNFLCELGGPWHCARPQPPADDEARNETSVDVTARIEKRVEEVKVEEDFLSKNNSRNGIIDWSLDWLKQY